MISKGKSPGGHEVSPPEQPASTDTSVAWLYSRKILRASSERAPQSSLPSRKESHRGGACDASGNAVHVGLNRIPLSISMSLTWAKTSDPLLIERDPPGQGL